MTVRDYAKTMTTCASADLNGLSIRLVCVCRREKNGTGGIGRQLIGKRRKSKALPIRKKRTQGP